VLDSIFAADSALMRVLGKIADVIVLNLVFVATSLPIVTLGASLTALHHTAMRIVRGRADSITADYLRAFRANLRPGSLLLLALVGLAAVLTGWYVVVMAFVVSPTLQLILLAVWFVMALQLATTSLFAFPYLATFDDPTKRVLRNACLMSWRHPLATLMVAVITGLPVVITIFYPKMTGYGLAWVAFGFAAIAVVAGMLLTRVFDQYIPASPAADTAENGTTHALT
jgi:uncharacterized membrane protein YesL